MRAAAEVALARVAETGDAEAASQAANLIGVLAETERPRRRPRVVAGRRSRRPSARTRRTGRGVQPRAHPAARTRRRDARGAGIRIGRPWACAARCGRGRARDGVLTVVAALDRAARSEDARARARGGASRRGGRRRRREEQRRGEDAGPDSGAARARRRAARGGRTRVRGRRGRGRPARARDDRGAQAADGLGGGVRRGRLPLDARRRRVPRARHGSIARGKSFARSARRSKTSRPGSPGSPTAPCRTCFRPGTSARSATARAERRAGGAASDHVVQHRRHELRAPGHASP